MKNFKANVIPVESGGELKAVATVEIFQGSMTLHGVELFEDSDSKAGYRVTYPKEDYAILDPFIAEFESSVISAYEKAVKL
jgi:hypothetical protein